MSAERAPLPPKFADARRRALRAKAVARSRERNPELRDWIRKIRDMRVFGNPDAQSREWHRNWGA